MRLLHLSIGAAAPEAVANVLARLMGGRALPFPPCPGAWIAFASEDDGTAVEVYPASARVEAGPDTIAFTEAPPDAGPSATHLALATPLPAEEVLRIGAAEGWRARICDRGPFACVELWVENRLLVEVLDPEMLGDYRAGMAAEHWQRMFGMTS